MSEHTHPTPLLTMWQKLKEQIPALLLTAILVFGVAYWFNQQALIEAAKQKEAIAALREQTAAEMKASAEETRRHIESVNQLLKDAISKRAADVFMTDEEVAKLNEQKVNQLAEAIAKKVMPYGANIPKTPEEAEKLQNEQVDKVSSRMAEKISPILAEMSKDQNLTRDSINAYSQRISDQISGVLTAEMSRNQELNTQLLASQAVAQDSMKLSHEITALYLSSFKDQGLLTRLLSLPANVVRDAASLSIVNSSDRKKMEERLVTQMNDLEKRLADVQAATPKK